MKNFLNVYDDTFLNNPYSYYSRMLQGESPYKISDGIYGIFCYEDVYKLLLNSNLYRDVYNKSTKIYQDSYRKKMTKYDFLLHLDPPKHSTIRKSISKYFTKKYITQMLSIIEKNTKQQINSIESSSALDIASGIGKIIPLKSIIEILGLPDNDYDLLNTWSEKISYAVEPHASEDQLHEILDIFNLFYEYIEKLINNNNLKNGLITDLLINKNNNLSIFDIICFSILMFEAGHQTSNALICNMVNSLAKNPEQLAKLIENNNLFENCVNESLRYESPVQQTVRAINCDGYLTLSNKKVFFSEGDIVVLFIAAANRDNSIFNNSHIFDIERANANKHIAYAAGAHHCLGHLLANAQGKYFLKHFLTKFNSITLKEDVIWKKALTNRVPEKLIVEFNYEK